MERELEILELLDYIIETSEETGRLLPFAAVKRSLSDLRQLVQNKNSEKEPRKPFSASLDQIERESDGNKLPNNTGEKRGGLASRIKPVPAEVRGRVRELVDLISDEDQFDDIIESNKA